MANALDDLKKTAETLKATIDQMKASGTDTRAMEDALRRVQSAMGGVATSAADTAGKIKTSNSVIVDTFTKMDAALGQIAKSVLNVGTGADTMAQQFKTAFNGTGIDDFAEGFDELTEMTRNLRTSAIGVGNAFGMSFDQIRSSYQGYISSVLLAQNNTYENRQEIQRQTGELAKLGIGLDDLSRTFSVAGTQQNILSEGFLLSADSGLRADIVFDMMGASMRKMGLSAEDAGKPLVALENIAKETGLPLTELSNKIFQTAQEGARLGLTVDSMTPIVRRFVDVLGPGFKGLAIDETTKLIRGLESQINTTQAAFMAMQGGLARPGAGVAEAQLAFEDAFKNPIEIVKSLQSTIGGVTGGKIIKFEEARANPELANQFKIQRDLLAQLTGNTDPQSQRTLMGILSDLQSGRQLTATQNKTLEESLKSGTQKQEEQKSLQDRIGKATVGLLTQISLNTSAMFDRLLPPQAQAGFARIATEKGVGLEQKGIELFNKALESGTSMLEKIPGVAGAGKTVKEVYEKTIATGEATAGTLRPSLNYNVPAVYNTPVPAAARAGVPPQTQPTPFANTPSPATPPGHAQPTVSTRTTTETGQKEHTNVTITFRGTDELTRALAGSASATVNKTLHGNG
jgi:hypothetical protein